MVNSSIKGIHDRDGYFDVIRVVALVRVIAFHVLRYGWLTLLFPSMGVMFALGGQMMAKSLERQGLAAVASRFRRVLPSLWLLGLVAIPGMAFFVDEWFPTLQTAVTWILPLTDPEGAESVGIIWQPLWYIRAYLWFVVLSPLLYFAFRRCPAVVLAVPVVALALVHDPGALHSQGRLAIGALDLLTYGGCWLIGFASHRGLLSQISLTRLIAVLVALSAIGVREMIVNWDAVVEYGISIIPTGNAAWSAAYSIVILRFRPGAKLIERSKSLAGPLRYISRRSMTIYLWHGPAILAAQLVLGTPVVSTWVMSSRTPDPMIWLLSTTVIMTAIAALVFGRLEGARPKMPAGNSRA